MISQGTILSGTVFGSVTRRVVALLVVSVLVIGLATTSLRAADCPNVRTFGPTTAPNTITIQRGEYRRIFHFDRALAVHQSFERLDMRKRNTLMLRFPSFGTDLFPDEDTYRLEIQVRDIVPRLSEQKEVRFSFDRPSPRLGCFSVPGVSRRAKGTVTLRTYRPEGDTALVEGRFEADLKQGRSGETTALSGSFRIENVRQVKISELGDQSMHMPRYNYVPAEQGSFVYDSGKEKLEIDLYGSAGQSGTIVKDFHGETGVYVTDWRHGKTVTALEAFSGNNVAGQVRKTKKEDIEPDSLSLSEARELGKPTQAFVGGSRTIVPELPTRSIDLPDDARDRVLYSEPSTPNPSKHPKVAAAFERWRSAMESRNWEAVMRNTNEPDRAKLIGLTYVALVTETKNDDSDTPSGADRRIQSFRKSYDLKSPRRLLFRTIYRKPPSDYQGSIEEYRSQLFRQMFEGADLRAALSELAAVFQLPSVDAEPIEGFANLELRSVKKVDPTTAKLLLEAEDSTKVFYAEKRQGDWGIYITAQ